MADGHYTSAGPKISYPTREQALDACSRRWSLGWRLRAYKCHRGEHWHLKNRTPPRHRSWEAWITLWPELDERVMRNLQLENLNSAERRVGVLRQRGRRAWR